MIEKEHVLNVLKEVKKAVENNDLIKLKDMSNQTLHSASIYQDADNIAIAVIIYVLSKILERTKYRNYPNWPSFLSAFMHHIDKAVEYLEKDNLPLFEKELKLIRKDVNHLSGGFKKDIQDVFQKASINKASRIYEHGISIEKTSKLLGISIFELAEYAGGTGVSEVDIGISIPVKTRIKNALEMFD